LSAQAVRELTAEGEALLGFVEPDMATAGIRFDDPLTS
jgi:hypothetical protein